MLSASDPSFLADPLYEGTRGQPYMRRRCSCGAINEAPVRIMKQDSRRSLQRADGAASKVGAFIGGGMKGARMALNLANESKRNVFNSLSS